MKYLKFYLAGLFFGLVLAKSEIISWYRIQEMFRFQSFHMYGVIGSAVIIGAISMFLIKKFNIKNSSGTLWESQKKEGRFPRYLYGGIIFGLEWALTGSCPGPMYILVGYGYLQFLVVILAAMLGTIFYGLIKDKLPH